jgi:hypothetical protein
MTLYGEPPRTLDWEPARARRLGHEWRADRFEGGLWPSVRVLRRQFGSFNAAIEAAGFTPRPAPSRVCRKFRGAAIHSRCDDRMDAPLWRYPDDGRLGPNARSAPRPGLANRAPLSGRLAERSFGRRALRLVCRSGNGGRPRCPSPECAARLPPRRPSGQSPGGSPRSWRLPDARHRRSCCESPGACAGADGRGPGVVAQGADRSRWVCPCLGRGLRLRVTWCEVSNLGSSVGSRSLGNLSSGRSHCSSVGAGGCTSRARRSKNTLGSNAAAAPGRPPAGRAQPPPSRHRPRVDSRSSRPRDAATSFDFTSVDAPSTTQRSSRW